MKLRDRITAEPDKMGGRPCIRGLRNRVTDVLEMLAAGGTVAEILADHPDLEAQDISAALSYAAEQIDHPVIMAPAAE